MRYNNEFIEDSFMWNSIKEVCQENGRDDDGLVYKIYKDLYAQSDAVGKSWNYKMIDRLYEKYA